MLKVQNINNFVYSHYPYHPQFILKELYIINSALPFSMFQSATLPTNFPFPCWGHLGNLVIQDIRMASLLKLIFLPMAILQLQRFKPKTFQHTLCKSALITVFELNRLKVGFLKSFDMFLQGSFNTHSIKTHSIKERLSYEKRGLGNATGLTPH